MTAIPPIKPYPMPAAGDLPANTARWTVDPARAVLLIHDMQRYFVRRFPPDRSPGEPLVANIAAVRERCAELGIPVAYTAQPGDMTAEQRGLLMDFWGPGMRVDPADQAIIEQLAPAREDWQFTKWRYSAFVGSDLLDRLRQHDRDQLLLCGVYAHVGVLMTGVEAFSRDIQPFLLADAVADFTEADHRMALDYAARTCAVVASTGWLLERLGEVASDQVQLTRS